MINKANFKDIGLVYILVIALIFGASFLLTFIITTISTISGVEVNILSQEKWFLYLNLFLSELVFALSFFIIVLIRKDKNFVYTYRLKFKFDLKLFLGILFLGVISVVFCVNITNAFNLGLSHLTSVEFSDSLGIEINSFWTFLLCGFFFAFLPALCEELVFRGIIFNGLRQKFNLKTAVLLSALMFMLVHFSIYKSFYQFILGIVLALIVYYTDSIFYGAVFHFANNFFIVLMNYLYSGGKTFFEFTYFGVKEIVLSIIIFAFGVFLAVLFFKGLKKYTDENETCFGLEKITVTHEKTFSDANFENLSCKQELKNNAMKNDGFGVFIGSLVFVVFLWLYCSFGGII